MIDPSAREALAQVIAEMKGLGLRTPFWRMLKRELPLCGARCRDGHLCRARAAWDGLAPYNGRCRMHGGFSTGPRTQEGRDRLSAAVKKMWAEHGEERRACISAGVRRYWDTVRQCVEELMRAESEDGDETP